MRNKRLYMMISIIALAIGFASVSAVLYINGTTTIEGDTASFESNVVFFEPNGSEGTDVVLSESGRTITFTTQEMKNIGDSATVNFKIKNYSQYDATLDTPALSCYFVNSYTEDTKSDKLSDTNEYLSITPGTNLNGATIAAGGSVSAESSVTVTQIKSYAGTEESNDPITIKFQCNINVTAGDSETPGIEKPAVVPAKSWTAVTGDGTQVGDEIAVGEEHFYVISNDGTTLKALAKYNLLVGDEVDETGNVTPLTNPTGIQSPLARGYVEGDAKWIGTVAFSDNRGWPYDIDDINIKEYAGPVKTALYDEDTGYESYIQQTIPNATVRLITKSEIEALVNDGATLSSESIKDKADAKGYQWLYSTSFWSSSVDSYYGGNSVWSVYSYGYFSDACFDNDYGFGVRPVIILES